MEGDRMDRAGRYVLGLMNDEERERAERDLEIDPAFREAMVTIAERMHVFGNAKPEADKPAAASQDPWRLIKDRIDAMPQMRPADTPLLHVPPAVVIEASPGGGAAPGSSTGQKSENGDKPATFGRRKTDISRVPVTVQESEAKRFDASRRAMAVRLAIALVVAFVLGYVVGRM